MEAGEEIGLQVPEEVASQRRVPATGPAGRDTGGHRDVFGDQRMLSQDRLQADVGAWNQPVRHQERMRKNFLEGRGQGVETSTKLVQAPGGDPARELPANVRRIDVSSQQEPGLEDRLAVHDLEEILESHGSNVARMASCCNGNSPYRGLPMLTEAPGILIRAPVSLPPLSD